MKLKKAGPVTVPVRLCEHRGVPVSVGQYTIYAGGTQHFQPGDLEGYDLIVPLVEDHRLPVFPDGANVRRYEIQDFQAPPKDFPEFLRELIGELEADKKILIFCVGGHGRTGTVLSGLKWLLEPALGNPIAAVRMQYCRHAVETQFQIAAILALAQLKP
ncbi:MAG: hypothetical protein AAB538_01220 [Patescibacteria group bacterium]